LKIIFITNLHEKRIKSGADIIGREDKYKKLS